MLKSLLSNYDPDSKPNYGDDTSPVYVGVTIYVLGVQELNEHDQTFTIQMYFRQIWNDPRLRYENKSLSSSINNAKQIIRLSESMLNSNSFRIWKPDTFFPNELSGHHHTLSEPNSFTWISPNGDVYRSIRVTLTHACRMEQKYYPFGRHVCSLEIESCKYGNYYNY